MVVLVFENDLLWSVRLANGIRALGHEAVVVDQVLDELPSGDVAIVNLGVEALMPVELVGRLKACGVFVIGHAGHKERSLHEAGLAAGCDKMVTNGQLAQRLDVVLGMV